MVGRTQRKPRPKPVYGKKKVGDDDLSVLPRRYTIVVFNVSNKLDDKVKNYMSANGVNTLEIKRFSSDEHFVHCFKVVIYRKDLDIVLKGDF